MMRIGFISDAHGNLPGFEAGLRCLERERVDHVVFLGDAVGYLPDPGVIRSLRNSGVPALRGNHEDMMIRSSCASEAIYQLERCRAQLSDSDLAWVSSLPRTLVLEIDGMAIALQHGSPSDPLNGYIYPDTDLDQFDVPGNAVVVSGHTHLPMCRRSASGALYCNPGSCGLPRDDGSRGAVGILDLSEQRFHVVRYDIVEATESWIARCEPVHASVKNLFQRRQTSRTDSGEYRD